MDFAACNSDLSEALDRTDTIEFETPDKLPQMFASVSRSNSFQVTPSVEPVDSCV